MMFIEKQRVTGICGLLLRVNEDNERCQKCSGLACLIRFVWAPGIAFMARWRGKGGMLDLAQRREILPFAVVSLRQQRTGGQVTADLSARILEDGLP